jgi:hypothetical protein
MTLQPLPSEFPYICGKFSFLFYQYTFNDVWYGLNQALQVLTAGKALDDSQEKKLGMTGRRVFSSLADKVGLLFYCLFAT